MEQPFKFLFSMPQSEISLRDDKNERIIQAKISENQNFLAIQCHSKKIIKLWNLKTNMKISDIELKRTVFLTLFEFSCDSQIFFYAEQKATELNMVYLNETDLIQKSFNILGQIDKVIFNQNNTQAVIINKENNFFSIWKIIEQQKNFEVQTQSELINSIFLDMKKFLIISVEQDEFTHYSTYSIDQQKIINQWKGRYISKNMNLHYNSNNQLLVIDFRDEYEHYIQIWNLYNFILVKHLYDDISHFYIKGIRGIQLVAEIEDESDEESEKDDEKSEKEDVKSVKDDEESGEENEGSKKDDEESEMDDEQSEKDDEQSEKNDEESLKDDEESEKDDVESQKEDEDSQGKNNCVTICIYNLLTGKINKQLTNIKKKNQYLIVNKTVIEQQVLEDNKSDIKLSFY